MEDKSAKKHRGESKIYESNKSYETLLECLDDLKNRKIEDAKWAIDVMEEIEAQEAEMEIQNEVEAENNSNENSAQSEIQKKKRERPTGSKNKPKSIQDQPQNKRTKKD
ncbi:hypothetical protein BpHYR1_008724 [Brachionus plicatilis]|uniref:Uncharacterized protein n=1 Tax=Brachionus plicatilis TaxID=10195 RepID=A0A3M7SRA4_BRAPC|nr:hypothetical protein BpHYR1_008724 [Brachionus plicatilis]